MVALPPHQLYVRRVARLLSEAGFLEVRLEEKVMKARWRVTGRPYVPFDITYYDARLPGRRYVESKHKRQGRATGEDVAKFLKDLEICGITTRRGLMVTNNGYEPQSFDYAAAAGLPLYVVGYDARATLPLWARTALARPFLVARQLLAGGGLPSTFVRVG